MAQVASPQGKEEKNNVPWRIAFTRKDLLAAAWGSKKGADLLYHFLHRASWEAKNQKLAADLNDIKIQSSLPKALDAASLSLGSYHTYLKHFVSAGYVSTEPYSKEITIHLEVIKAAFAQPPEKPVSDGDKPKKPRSKSFNLKDCNFVTLPVAEYEAMVAESFKLKEMFQSLKDSAAELKEMFQSLKDSNSRESTPEERLRAIFDARYALENRDALDFFGGAPSEASYSQEMEQPTEEKKEEPIVSHMAEWLADLDTRMDALDQEYLKDCSHRSWLQETSMQDESASQAPSELFPEPPKPNKHNIPDLRAGLNDRSQRPPTPAEQKRMDAAEERHKATMAAKREQEIWAHYASLLETSAEQIIRDDFSKRAVKALIQANATDEGISLTFKYLKNKKLATTLAFIASNLNSVVADSKPKEKPKSDLLNMTDWTDEEYDHWRRTNETPIRARRVQA